MCGLKTLRTLLELSTNNMDTLEDRREIFNYVERERTVVAEKFVAMGVDAIGEELVWQRQ